MKFLKKYFRLYCRDIFLGQGFKLIEAVLELCLPLVMASLIDGVARGEGGTRAVLSSALIMLLIALVGVLTALVCQYVASRASQNFGTQLRRDLFEHVMRLSAPEFSRFGAASLTTRELSDVNQLQQALAMLIRLVVRAPFLAVGSIVMAIVLDIQLSVVFIVATPLIALSMYLIMRLTLPRFSALQKALDGITSAAREALLGARVMRAFSRQRSAEKSFDVAADKYASDVARVGLLSALLSPLGMIVMNFGVLFVLWLGGARAQEGLITQGVVVAFINYLAQILLQTAVVANLANLFTRAGAAAKRVGEVMDTAPSIVDGSGATPDFTAPAVQFSHVTFAYPDADGDWLRDISFTLHKGRTLGVIGGTGAGKSTVLSLIPRLYDVTSGDILIFGAPARQYTLKRLRALMGYVPQKQGFIGGSVRDNLLLGDPTATDDDLWRALSIAQAKEFVGAFPDGLDHALTEDGQNLSGGQRQRLGIARAVLKKPEILLMDDASSALDYLTDSAMRSAVKREIKDAAVILVSQRVAVVRDCDEILVLDEGVVVGQGTHAELLETCAVYEEICRSQRESEGMA